MRWGTKAKEKAFGLVGFFTECLWISLASAIPGRKNEEATSIGHVPRNSNRPWRKLPGTETGTAGLILMMVRRLVQHRTRSAGSTRSPSRGGLFRARRIRIAPRDR